MKLLLFVFVIIFSLSSIKEVSAQTGTLATDGVYVPRLSTTQRDAISNPDNGQMIYNTDDDCFNIYQRGTWQKLRGLDVSYPGEWIPKANFGGASRIGAVGFSIGNKGYIGTGFISGGTNLSDFWEYNPVTNVWTQKANFGGGGRTYAVGFSIGSKGYIGTGNEVGINNDFWEYNSTTNVWTKKANFGGGVRAFATGFSIGSRGYIGTGYDITSAKNDFWEYNPTTDVWTQKANFGGNVRGYAVGLLIGNKGY